MCTLYFDKAIALYQNGSSVKDIANQFPVCAGTVALWVHEYKRTHPENYSKTLKETYYGEAIRLNKEKALIPVRSAKLCGALTHEALTAPPKRHANPEKQDFVWWDALILLTLQRR